jgi:YesN/AraC family two-component response regulator
VRDAYIGSKNDFWAIKQGKFEQIIGFERDKMGKDSSNGFFEKVYSKPVPKNYSIVFPEPFVSTKQSNLFLDKMQRIYQLEPIKKANSNNIVIQFIRYINENYTEDISLESMAQTFSYSVGRCSTLFNEGMGMSFKQYLNHVRMQAMKTLLKENKYTKMEIMEMCGYNSPVTFYRHYKTLNEKK